MSTILADLETESCLNQTAKEMIGGSESSIHGQKWRKFNTNQLYWNIL